MNDEVDTIESEIEPQEVDQSEPEIKSEEPVEIANSSDEKKQTEPEAQKEPLPENTKAILEAAIMAAGEPLSVERMKALFTAETDSNSKALREVLLELKEDYLDHGIELKEVGSGFRFQARIEFKENLARLWEEKPPRFSRAYLETLALIAYKQPISRGEIEEVRGVSVSSHIVKSMLDREWIKVVGHKEVPGKPALFGTTKAFLDYFNLKALNELPLLSEITNLDEVGEKLESELGFMSGIEEMAAMPESTDLDEALDLEVEAAVAKVDQIMSDTFGSDEEDEAQSDAEKLAQELQVEEVVEAEMIAESIIESESEDTTTIESEEQAQEVE